MTRLRGSELVKTKIFPTSFGRGRFQGNLLIIRWRQIDFGIPLCHHLSSKVTCCCGLGKNEREKIARIFSFSICWVLDAVRTDIHKFSRCIKRLRKMSLELEVFTSLSMTIDLAWLLKLWPCCWKCLQESIACILVFLIFSMIVQSNVKCSFCFSYVLFITQRAFHQVNNVLTFAVNYMIDFKFPFCLLTDKCRCWC